MQLKIMKIMEVMLALVLLSFYPDVAEGINWKAFSSVFDHRTVATFSRVFGAKGSSPGRLGAFRYAPHGATADAGRHTNVGVPTTFGHQWTQESATSRGKVLYRPYKPGSLEPAPESCKRVCVASTKVSVNIAARAITRAPTSCEDKLVDGIIESACALACLGAKPGVRAMARDIDIANAAQTCASDMAVAYPPPAVAYPPPAVAYPPPAVAYPPVAGAPTN